MIYHLRNVRNWTDFVAEVGDFSREAPRCGGDTIIYGAGHQLPVFCGGLPAFSPLFGYLFGTVYATPHSELRRALRQPSTPRLAISERLPGAVADDEVGFGFLGGPRWREAARAHFLQPLCLGAPWQVPSGS